MIPGAVTISYLYPRETAGPFTDSLMHLACDPWAQEHIFSPKTGGQFITVASGPLVADARNQIVEAFLDQTEGEWLMMIDSDHTFAPNAIQLLVEWGDPMNAPIVGGLCFTGGRNAKISPTMFHISDDGEGGICVQTVERWTAGKVVEVSATGASFLLVHRYLLEDMRTAYKASAPLIWFANGFGKGAQIGEDVFFCIRAKKLGAKIFVHTGVEAPHIKQWVIDSTDYAAFLEQRDEHGMEALELQLRKKLVGVVEPPPPVAVGPNREQRRARKRAAA